MLNRLGIAAFTLALSATPAFAVGAQIVFLPNTTVQPSYSTAAIVQSFSSPQVSETNFVTNISNAAGTTETTTGNSNNIRVLNNNSTMVGQYLVLRSATYTLNFDNVGQFATGVRYLSFLIGNYKSANDSVVLHFKDGTNTGNILAGLLGLNDESATNSHGMVVINQNQDSAIDSVTFSSLNTSGINQFRIDEIAAATPEPAAWLMMIFGFGLVGAQLRRRRSPKRVAA